MFFGNLFRNHQEKVTSAMMYENWCWGRHDLMKGNSYEPGPTMTLNGPSKNIQHLSLTSAWTLKLSEGRLFNSEIHEAHAVVFLDFTSNIFWHPRFRTCSGADFPSLRHVHYQRTLIEPSWSGEVSTRIRPPTGVFRNYHYYHTSVINELSQKSERDDIPKTYHTLPVSAGIPKVILG